MHQETEPKFIDGLVEANNKNKKNWDASQIIDTTRSGVAYIRYRKARTIMDKGGVCACEDGEYDYYTVMDGQIVGYDAIPNSPVYIVSGPNLAKIRSSHKWHWKAD